MTTALDTFRLLTQLQANLTGLQSELRSNAAEWKNSVTSQPVEMVAQWMNDCATAYYARLAWVTKAQQDSANWAKVIAMYGVLGGLESEITALCATLHGTVDQLAAAPKTTVAEVNAAANAIINDVPATLSLWPE